MSIASEAAQAAPRSRVRGFGSLALAALVGFLSADSFQAPTQQVASRMALYAIDTYRTTVSPVLGRTHLVVCRFHPTCSAYGREAIARYGIVKGMLLATGRVLRCHPFAKGGEDPVP